MSSVADRLPIVELRLLSLALEPPHEAQAAELRALALTLLEHGASPEVAELLDSLETDGPGEAYEELFGGTIAVAPYEGSYESDPFRQARQLSDLAGFYAAFGAASRGPAHERPDHAGCELEFLAFLGARRVAAEELGRVDEAQRCAEAEDDFLADHAGRWLPGFFAALQRADESGFYGAVGRLGERVLTAELSSRGLAPTAPARAERTAVELDAFDCG